MTEYTGSTNNSSLRWVKTTYDLLGRVEKVERPGYGSSVVLTKTHHYDTKGRLDYTIESAPEITDKVTRYTYHYHLGYLQYVVQDIDNSGGLQLASTDRAIGYTYTYERNAINTHWFRVKTTLSYPTDGSAVAQTLSIEKTQLSGLGSLNATHGYLTAYSIVEDAYGKKTYNSTYVMLDDAGTGSEQKVTHISDVPTSTQNIEVVVEGGLTTSETSATNVETDYTYDELERLSTKTVESSANGNTGNERLVSGTYAYYSSGKGKVGQLESVTDANNKAVTYDYYTATGLKKSETKPTATLSDGTTQQTITTTYTYYDLTGRLKKVAGGQYPVEYDYDAVFGQMDSLKTWQDTSGSAVETTWGYDAATGLLLNKRYDNAGGTGKGPTYTYYADGKLATRTWARNSSNPPTATYSYDLVTRDLTGIVYSGLADSGGSIATTDITYSNYDRLGRPRSVIDGQGTRTLSYEAGGKLDLDKISSGAYAYTLDREFDLFGRPAGYDLTGVTPTQNIDYGYDSLGRFSTVDNQSDTFTYTWADGANLLRGYSTAGGSPAVSVAYDYETGRDLKDRVINQSLGVDVSEYDYLYDEIGRRKQRTDDATLVNKFNYNERSEVIGADMDGTTGYEDTYTFDDIGNRTASTDVDGSSVYTPNELNQYATITGAMASSPSHDLDGNLMSDGTWSYGWNAENRLVSVESSASVLLANRQRLEFAYDFMGRRYEKKAYTYNDQLSTPDYELQTTTVFVYDGWNMIHEAITDNVADPETTSYKSHTWGLDLSQTFQGAGGVGGLLSTVIKDGTAATYYPVGDANGNITEYVNASGATVASYVYDSFGKHTSGGTQVADFNFRFSSKYEDTETGFNYYGFRYYDSGIGRWLNRDPMGETGGINVYGFVNNGSTFQVDPHGLESFFYGMPITGPLPFRALTKRARDQRALKKVLKASNLKTLGEIFNWLSENPTADWCGDGSTSMSSTYNSTYSEWNMKKVVTRPFSPLSAANRLLMHSLMHERGINPMDPTNINVYHPFQYDDEISAGIKDYGIDKRDQWGRTTHTRHRYQKEPNTRQKGLGKGGGGQMFSVGLQSITTTSYQNRLKFLAKNGKCPCYIVSSQIDNSGLYKKMNKFEGKGLLQEYLRLANF